VLLHQASKKIHNYKKKIAIKEYTSLMLGEGKEYPRKWKNGF